MFYYVYDGIKKKLPGEKPALEPLNPPKSYIYCPEPMYRLGHL